MSKVRYSSSSSSSGLGDLFSCRVCYVANRSKLTLMMTERGEVSSVELGGSEGGDSGNEGDLKGVHVGSWLKWM